MSILSRLFGGGEPSGPKGPDDTYKEFSIFAEPGREGSQYRVGARIEKDIDGETKTHVLVRADVLESRDLAVEVSVSKARQIIDEQGERIFN